MQRQGLNFGDTNPLVQELKVEDILNQICIFKFNGKVVLEIKEPFHPENILVVAHPLVVHNLHPDPPLVEMVFNFVYFLIIFINQVIFFCQID